MSASKSTSKRSKKPEFVWTDDEAELLLNVTHNYKVQQLVEGTCWESVRSKYVDILELFKNELPASEEEARETVKDYPHKRDEVTKEVLTAKLKTIRTKFCQVIGIIILDKNVHIIFYDTLAVSSVICVLIFYFSNYRLWILVRGVGMVEL